MTNKMICLITVIDRGSWKEGRQEKVKFCLGKWQSNIHHAKAKLQGRLVTCMPVQKFPPLSEAFIVKLRVVISIRCKGCLRINEVTDAASFINMLQSLRNTILFVNVQKTDYH